MSSFATIYFLIWNHVDRRADNACAKVWSSNPVTVKIFCGLANS